MIKCIIFDAYGTLISTGNGSIDAVKQILLNKELHISPEEFYKKWKELHRNHIDGLTSFINEKSVFEKDLKALYAFYDINGDYKKDVIYMINSLKNRSAYPETNNVLNILSKLFYICIGSTTDTEPLLNNLKKNNIKIDAVFTSEFLKIYKPQKNFYLEILNKTGFKPSEVLFVGDSLIDDIYGPQQINIMTCLVKRKSILYDNKIHPDYTINNLEEIFFIPPVQEIIKQKKV